VGITDAGSREYGTLKSAAGIGAILLRGIGDTIRVSLLGDPVPEIAAGFDILRACDRRVNKPEVVACPTCGRLDIDLERIVAEVEAKMAHLKNPLRISILGCLVNGFGEAKEADLGIAAGAGKGIIFKRGKPIRHVKEAEMVQALLEEVERFDEDTPALKSHQEKPKSALTVLS
jgi:(E)-4-hydroxy-3-methylbut-2-enyl-diphosphate synthase